MLFFSLTLRATENDVEERARRIPPLADTVSIELSRTASDSSGYVVIYPSGKLTFVPSRSSIKRHPGGRSTDDGVVVFSDIYKSITQVAVLEKKSQDDRLVYFERRGSSGTIAVYIPAARTAIAEKIFKLEKKK